MSRLRLIALSALMLLAMLPAGPALAQVPTLISVSEGAGTAVIWDNMALSDAITYTMTGVPPPGPGREYVGWLVSDDGSVKLNTGAMAVAADGSISHIFDSGNKRYTGENLIFNYDRVVITDEQAGDDPDEPAGPPVFSHQIPPGAIAHIRHLLADWPPGSGVGILTNLKLQLNVALTHANLASAPANTLAQIKQHLEHVVNAIEGPNGANYGDLDGNGATQDFGDGIGALVHASDKKHAGFAPSAALADEVVNAHALLVEIDAANAATWAALAVGDAITGISQTNIDVAKIFVARVTGLMEDTLGGVDADASGTIDSVVGEGAADLAYVEAQFMATYTLQAGAAPATPGTGDASVTLLAAIALILGAVLLGAGGLLVVSGRRSRTPA